MKTKIRIIIYMLAVLLMTACGKGEKETDKQITPTNILSDMTPTAKPEEESTITSSPAPTPTVTPTPMPTADPYEGKKQSLLTGEWIDEDAVETRPFAVMLNNIKAANPQSGIGQADIVYEALTEAGITRFLAIFTEFAEGTPVAERLGSVRSARHYFVSIADEFDAIFVHYGETTYATKKMKELGIDHISGMYGAGSSAFYRDKTIKAPHNAFGFREGILKAVEKAKIRTEYEEGYQPHYSFYPERTVPNGEQTVKKVTIDFSNYMKPYFIYDEKSGKYLRYQFDGEHIDYNTKEQLTFDNLIIWVVKQRNKDKNGYQTIDFEEAEGKAYYLTAGTIQQVTWKKSEKNRMMRFYGENGEELILNPGKTYVAVFPENRVERILFEESEDAL